MRPESKVLFDRVVAFGISSVHFARAFRHDETVGHIANQLSRAATSAAASYAEACEAESRPDFVHKMKLGLKELRECEVWIRTVLATTPSPDATALAAECNELIAIFVASVRTAKQRLID